jgi:hypothetical protein
MKPMTFVLTALAWLGVAANDPVVQADFENCAIGELPQGWSNAKTGIGEGSVWKVVHDTNSPKGSKVLAQTAAGPTALFNLCVLDGVKILRVDASVAFKPVAGTIDQGGGIVWRYQDHNNYYITRFNPLEKNLRAYKVIDGKRHQLATVENLDAKSGQWHTLRVEHADQDEIDVYLNGKKLISVAAESTINKSGQVGLWTKADSQTYFDDFKAINKSKN